MKKETLDASLQSMVGTPVIIKHQNVTKENADKLRIGTISKAYFNEPDGWFYCEGIIWDEKAQDLIENKNWSVSCSYDFLAYNDEGGEENNIHYDKEFTNLNFTHLAIVDNPRYERANIVFNCKIDNADDQKGRWITIHPNGEDEKGRHLLIKDGETPKEAIERTYGKGEKSDTKDKQSDKEDKNKYLKKGDLETDKVYKLGNLYVKPFVDDDGDLAFYDRTGAWGEGSVPQKFLKSDLKNLERVEKYDKLTDKELKFLSEKGDFKQKEPKQSDTKDGKEEKENNYSAYFSDKRTGMSMYDDVLEDEHYANTKQRFPKVITISPQKYIDTVADGFDKMHLKYDDNPVRVTSDELVKSRTDEKLNKLREKFGKEQFDMPMIGYEMQKDRSTDMAFQEGIHRAILAKEAGLKEIPVAIYSTGRYGEKFTNEELKDNLDKVIKNLFNNKTNNSKEQDMALLEELKKLIFKVENNKENEMEIDKKVENEQVDKRKLIDEVAGIMKSAGCDDEVIRTAIGKMEKIGYDKSEADDKTDNKKVKNEDDEEDKKDKKDEVKNKCKNEDEEDKKEVKEVKEEVKEDVDNKCKNSKEDTSSFDKINEIYNSVRQLKETKTYVSRQEKLDNAVEYFK